MPANTAVGIVLRQQLTSEGYLSKRIVADPRPAERRTPALPAAVSALVFDGRDDYVALPDAATLGMGGSFTIEALVLVEPQGHELAAAVLGSGDTQFDWSVPLPLVGGQPFSTGYDRTIRLSNATSGQLQAVLAGHVQTVCAVAFSPQRRTPGERERRSDRLPKAHSTSSTRCFC
ncbi:MAG TPA: hypothetical protein VFU22_03145 [Roseiflexaceae bacterium]|nr:hypothetical protein [Roseiflexaceae bacterium]